MKEQVPNRVSAWLRVGESILYVVALFAGMAVIWELGHLYFGPRILSVEPNGIQAGAQLRWPGIKWDAGRENLVFVLKAGCAYCAKDAGFDRTLIRTTAHDPIRTVVVLPDPYPEAKAYLQSLGIQVPEIHQATFKQMGIYGAPALILVGPRGRVQASWLGSLSFPRQEDVFRVIQTELRSHQSPELPGHLVISAAGVRALMLSKRSVEILDVRPRAAYRKGHISRAINIPIDEIYVRAPHEITGSSVILIYCHWCGGCETTNAAEGIGSSCSFSVVLLRKLGYTSIKIIDADLVDLRKAGVKLVGTPQE